MATLASKVSNLMGKTIGKAHSSVYRASNGRVWGKMFGGPVMLLNTM
ncbi:MAG: hypothetical protein M3317_13890 [Actinomycetota bacterium]|nr:hypothetical protein [Actinomycetota bacterium]